MLIRLLCAREMNKYVCKISHLNSKRLLRKLQKSLGGYLILPHPVCPSDINNMAYAHSCTFVFMFNERKTDAILTTVVYDDAYFLFSRRLTSYLWCHLSNVI